jgi:hypothetical protein
LIIIGRPVDSQGIIFSTKPSIAPLLQPIADGQTRNPAVEHSLHTSLPMHFSIQYVIVHAWKATHRFSISFAPPASFLFSLVISLPGFIGLFCL